MTGFAAIPNWIVRDSSISSNAKLVYMALACHTDKHEVCWPGQALIGTEVGLSVPTVRKGLNELRDLGLLEWDTVVGANGRHNRYRMTSPHQGGPAPTPGGGQKRNDGGSETDVPTHQKAGLLEEEPLEEEPKKNPPTPQRGASDSAPGFEQWWQRYPRKTGKIGAGKAYRAALKHTTPDALLAALEAQRDGLLDREERFRPHPATWLNRGSWADEPVVEDEQLSYFDRQARFM